MKMKIKYTTWGEKNIDADSLKNHKKFWKDYIVILKLQQKFRSKKHILFTKKFDKIALSASGDKRLQTIDYKEAFPYGTSKSMIRKKEKIKYRSIINQFKDNVFSWFY